MRSEGLAFFTGQEQSFDLLPGQSAAKTARFAIRSIHDAVEGVTAAHADPFATQVDFTELDALADVLWPDTEIGGG